MSRLSIEQLVTTPATTNYLSESPYDYTKWNLGKAMIYNNGVTDLDKYITPHFDIIRPMEEATAFAILQIAAYTLNTTYVQIFGIENLATAVNTRRIGMWTINRKTGVRSWNGFITLTLSSATAHTCRYFNMDVKVESTGAASASGTTVTGNGTAFATNKVAIGARIGFGSTDPGQITTWYRVTARGSDTSLTINTSAGTVDEGPYVIQEYRPIYYATNATTINGGIHYVKGITPEDFTSGGTTIGMAVSTDDQKAIYWLKDAVTQTDIYAAGASCDFANATATSLIMYTNSSPAALNYKFYKYNIRTALTVATGASVSAWILATGNNVVTGAISQNANLCMANTNHGTGTGVLSLYLITVSRIYRVPVSQITTTSTTVFSSPSDSIIEIPPGGTSTYAATGVLNTIEYLPALDSFVVGTSHAGGVFSYITKYVASGTAFENMFGRDYKYLEQSLKNSYAPSFFSNQATTFIYTDAGGNRVFACKQGNGITNNHIYILPFGVDWNYAVNTKGRLISPEILTPNVLKYYRVFANQISFLGDTTLGKITEPYRIYARTANIQTNESDGWALIDETNSLASFAGAASIQFAIEFKTIGESCLPARILGINLSYEDNTTDSHYAVSVAKSSLVNKEFSFWFKTAFGGTVPTLEIALYDADTGGLLLTDNTVTHAAGTWQKTTDGTNWVAYDTNDRGNDNTWVRYTPSSLADNIKVAAYLRQL